MILVLSNQNNKKKLVDELSDLVFVLVKNTYLFIDIQDKFKPNYILIQNEFTEKSIKNLTSSQIEFYTKL